MGRDLGVTRLPAGVADNWRDPQGSRLLLNPLNREPRQPFSTWPNSSSTGVARPKIDTATLSRERASSTSSTTPLKDAKGPSETRTCSTYLEGVFSVEIHHFPLLIGELPWSVAQREFPLKRTETITQKSLPRP